MMITGQRRTGLRLYSLALQKQEVSPRIEVQVETLQVTAQNLSDSGNYQWRRGARVPAKPNRLMDYVKRISHWC
jgi:hypothetical protein